MSDFYNDVWRGLNASPKYLQSKYFYDAKGDAIFREIMNCPEYYLTNCELEIFSQHNDDLANTLLSHLHDFDVVELGAGDATKSIYLLEALLKQNVDFTYYPIDISENIIALLNKKLPEKLSGINVKGLNGEYFDMLDKLKEMSNRNKVVLFLGSNVGNILLDNTVDFFTALRSHMSPGDLVLTGFDLKKDPAVVLAAYNDKAGITKRFNLNLLQRINDTFDADFDLLQFEHRPVYNEQTGACKSYLVSKKDQRVRIGEAGWIYLKEGEQIFMEISQKYTVRQTDEFAQAAGFVPVGHFYDERKWFLDALWQVAS
jgi:L-histidine N-alpha-methyltransferase